MRALWLAPLLALSCRYLAPAQTPVSAARPSEPPLPERPTPIGNRCGVVCGAGFHCDERSAACVPEAGRPDMRDGGPAWLP
jgi:hypothetical protein